MHGHVQVAAQAQAQKDTFGVLTAGRTADRALRLPMGAPASITVTTANSTHHWQKLQAAS